MLYLSAGVLNDRMWWFKGGSRVVQGWFKGGVCVLCVKHTLITQNIIDATNNYSYQELDTENVNSSENHLFLKIMVMRTVL